MCLCGVCVVCGVCVSVWVVCGWCVGVCLWVFVGVHGVCLCVYVCVLCVLRLSASDHMAQYLAIVPIQ